MSVSEIIRNSLVRCNHCPRECGVNRISGKLGFCKTGTDPLVASICIHKGEEPVISGDKGICNVFFAHCNLSCTYCQNHQISENKAFRSDWLTSYDEIVAIITQILDSGINRIGFVSPTHQLLQMTEIIERVNRKGYFPTIIYNTNLYENPQMLRAIESIINVYLPDFKYYSDDISKELSGIKKYSEPAFLALKEMIWQKGTSLIINDEGLAQEGVIVRHLILPGQADDSIKILELLANKLSNNINISLMSQYYPTKNSKRHPTINRRITQEEYDKVVIAMDKLGFYRGWLQNMDSSFNYQPNFMKKDPFDE